VGSDLRSITYIPWALATALAVLAGWRDFRTRRIPNWLTLSGFSIGLATNALEGGWAGAKASLVGAGIGLLVLLPVVLLRGLGAGDWKLMGSLGAIVGSKEILQLLFVAVILAGVLALVQMIREKRVLVTLLNLWQLIRGFFVFGLKPHPEINLENPQASTLPFGVAVAAATVLCCGVALAGI
jgi:prepilin peptidase CpaA